MPRPLTIALDAMGGDRGPEVVVPGADLALERWPEIRLLLFGDQAKLDPIIARYPRVRDRSEVVHTDVAVAMEDKPSQALRRGRHNSSMWMTIDAVRTGRADVAVSAGNTGALMAMAKVILKTMPGISRPAIAGLWPTLRGDSVVLDLGATIGADAEQLFDYAIMGEAMARCMLGMERPTVGLLNVGIEEMKGVEEVRKAGKMLREAELPIEYYGFVEGDDIGKGTVDVFVIEGFTGNIALKAAEGTVRLLTGYLREAMNRTWMTRLGYFFARGAFDALRARLDPRTKNGGVFLGLNGIVVKSHGGTDGFGFAAAIDVAVETTRSKLIDKIAADLAAKQSATQASLTTALNAEGV
ncbi:glycerol-3-phosphate acyltransferase PlsX [Rhodoligotrophos appendicifer]|uniref:phosphate acyltransferase PlsX n=1 Tax=Rhodoligotrophos appendicifer TaxID=987056 RepID=UPI00118623F3|nr:phosphate acyltransferase PlsX [Rhodoligotrophos appendicifer]